MTDIVILDIREMTGGLCQIRFCTWFAVANPYPAPGFTSAYLDINSDSVVGPAGENVPAKLITGELVEEVFSVPVPAVMIANSWATVQAYLLAILNARKNYKAGSAQIIPNPGLKYKIRHDSATNWSA